MKLINPLSPNARLAIAGAVIEADARGVVEVKSEDVAASLLKSGYVLLEKHEADTKVQKATAKAAEAKKASASAEAIKAAKEEAEAAKKAAAQVEDVVEEAVEEAVEEVEAEEDKPKRGWSRKTSSKKG